MGIVLALLIAVIPGAMADEGRGSGDRGWGRFHEIERIDVVKVVTGKSDNTVTSQVTSLAITGKEGKAAVITFPTPLPVYYNTTYAMGYASTRGMDTADIAVRPIDNATLSVAGASLVATIWDVKVILDDKDYLIFEYRKLGIYLPDGTGHVFKLDRPVKVLYNKGRKSMTVDAYPAVAEIIGSYVGTATFPSGAPPVKLGDIARAEWSGGIRTIGTAPLAPSPSPTPSPTPSPSTGP